jgi:magnesium transporter
MKRPIYSKRQSATRGLPPGTPVYVGQPRTGPVRVTLTDYDENTLTERQVEDPSECQPFRDKGTVTWINVDGIHDIALVGSFAEMFGLHPLVVEDILNTEQRPKIEDFGEHVYVVLKMLQWDGDGGRMVSEQVSILFGRDFVLTFQERPGDLFGSIRERIRSTAGRIRKMGADYLAYSMVDAIVDGYFAILEKKGEQIELLEDELVSDPTTRTLRKIYHLRGEGLFLRRSVWPVRELVANMERMDSPLIADSIRAYVRDLYDHSVQAIETAETFREMLSGMLDTYLSSLSNRMNEVMKVLTIIATIFIPLTFITGVYGMNFHHMPELDWRWGYPLTLGVMAALAIGMILMMKRKKWL